MSATITAADARKITAAARKIETSVYTQFRQTLEFVGIASTFKGGVKPSTTFEFEGQTFKFSATYRKWERAVLTITRVADGAKFSETVFKAKDAGVVDTLGADVGIRDANEVAIANLLCEAVPCLPVAILPVGHVFGPFIFPHSEGVTYLLQTAEGVWENVGCWDDEAADHAALAEIKVAARKSALGI